MKKFVSNAPTIPTEKRRHFFFSSAITPTVGLDKPLQHLQNLSSEKTKRQSLCFLSFIDERKFFASQ